jgi:PKD repeat protein
MKIPKRSVLVFFVATIAIIACREPQADFTSDKTKISTGEVISFTNQTINGDSYEWDFDDGIVSNEENPTHKYVNEGSFEVKLTAFSKNKKKYDYVTKSIKVTRENEILYNGIHYPLDKGYSIYYGAWAHTGAYNFDIYLIDDRMIYNQNGLSGTGNFIYLELWSPSFSEISFGNYDYSQSGGHYTYSNWMFGFNCNLATEEGDLYSIAGTPITITKNNNEYTIKGSITVVNASFSFYFKGQLVMYDNSSKNSFQKMKNKKLDL